MPLSPQLVCFAVNESPTRMNQPLFLWLRRNRRHICKQQYPTTSHGGTKNLFRTQGYHPEEGGRKKYSIFLGGYATPTPPSPGRCPSIRIVQWRVRDAIAGSWELWEAVVPTNTSRGICITPPLPTPHTSLPYYSLSGRAAKQHATNLLRSLLHRWKNLMVGLPRTKAVCVGYRNDALIGKEWGVSMVWRGLRNLFYIIYTHAYKHLYQITDLHM